MTRSANKLENEATIPARVRWHESLWSASRDRSVAGIAIALLGAPAATLLATRLEFARALPFVVVIVAATVVGRLVAGVVATVVSAALFSYFVIDRAGSFRPQEPEALITVVLFVVTALAISWILAWQERARIRAAALRDEAEDASVRLQFALEAGELGTWLWDIPSGRVEWDEALERLFGLEPGAFDGSYETYRSLLHPDDVDEVEASIGRALKEDVRHQVEHRIVRPDGQVRWVEGSGTVRRNGSGEPVSMVGVARDITTRRRAEEQAQQIQAVTDAALAELHPDELIPAVLERIRRALETDSATLLTLSEDRGEFIEFSTAGSDHPSDGVRRSPSDLGVAGSILRSATPLVVEDLAIEDPVGPWLDSMVSFAGVPLILQDEVIGVLHVATDRLRRFGEDDVALLRLAGARLAAALDRSNLFEQELMARRESEEANARLRMLAEMSEVLSSSLDYEMTVSSVAQAAVPGLADWCSIELLDDMNEFHQLAVAHVDPDKVDMARRLRDKYPPDPDAPMGVPAVVRTGQPELVPHIPAEVLEQATEDYPELRELIVSLQLESAMTVPLIARGRTLGAMSFVAAGSGRHFDEQDLSLATEIGRRAAIAIDNARLFDERNRVARTFEESLQAPSIPSIPGMDVGSRYRPGGEQGQVAGDFYDLVPLSGDRWLAVVGDVSGKGPEAAAVMALARYTVRTAALNESAPAAILRVLNEALLRSESDRFCTAVVVLLEVVGNGRVRVTVSTGGHLPPLVLRDGAVHPAPCRGTLLGMSADPDLGEWTTELDPGEGLVLYTDGVTEERRDQEQFGESRLTELLAELHELPANELAGAVVTAVEQFSEGQPRDDIAILVLRNAARERSAS